MTADERVASILADWSESQQRGEWTDPVEVIRAHPDLAERLRLGFAALDYVDLAVGAGPEAPESGECVGPYRIEALLGSGGMGTVFRAVRDGQSVALKVVHPHLLRTPGGFKRFLREAEVGRRVKHPNVVRTLDVGGVEREGRHLHYLAMEYVEGRTLRDLQDELERVPETLCRHIATEVAQGLAAIHAAGAVHRDLKPENVLITDDHVVKVMDLGVAQLAEESIRLSQSGGFVGSLEYAAPEQFGGGDVDGRCDLHGLGVLLYELSTGQHPFRADTFPAVMKRVREDVPRRLGEIDEQLSPYFEELVRTLLAKRPDERLASANVLSEVLIAGEESVWWRDRARDLQHAIAGPLRRITIPRETAVHGRADEVSRLRELWERALDGRGQVVLIEGEAGIGKSRLVDEFIAQMRDACEDFHFLFGSYPPTGAGVSGGACSSAFREHFGASGSARYLTATPSLVPAFDAFLAEVPTGPDDQSLTDATLKTCFVHSMRAIAAERPTVLVIDDLHFATEEGRELFSSLSLAAPGHRVLLVGTMRPGVPRPWLDGVTGLEQTSTLHVPRLGPKSLVALLEDALGSRRLAEELGGRVGAKSDGNPFFVHEIVRGLKEGQFIRRRPDGTWETTRIINEIEVPSTVLDLVATRVADLAGTDRPLLDVAACCGFDFDPTLVAEALDMPRIPVLQAFARIEHTHRLVRSAGRRYVFDHHLVLETLYSALFEPLREEYHAAIATKLEQRAGVDEVETDELEGAIAVSLCEHFLRAGCGERSVRYLDGALDYLDLGWERARAAALIESVLTVPGIVDHAETATLCMRLCGHLACLGRIEVLAATVDRALAAAAVSGSRGLVASAERWRCNHLCLVGNYDEAHAAVLRSREHALAADDEERIVAADVKLAQILMHQGRFDEADEALERTRDAAARWPMWFNLMGELRAGQGRPEDAEEAFGQWLALEQDAEDRGGQGGALSNLGLLAKRAGQYERAEELDVQALECHRHSGNRLWEATTTAALASLHSLRGKWDDALAGQQHALALARELGASGLAAQVMGEIGVAHGLAGRWQEAARWTQAAVDSLEAAGDRVLAIPNKSNLGWLAFYSGDAEVAISHFESAEREAREIGAAFAVALDQQGLGEARCAIGDLEFGRDLLSKALKAFQDGTYRREESATLMYLGRAAEAVGSLGEAERCYSRSLSIRRDHGASPDTSESLTHLGAVLARTGRRDEGVDALEEAIRQGRRCNAPGPLVLASCHLAALGHVEPSTAAALRTEYTSRLQHREAMASSFLLWQATQELRHLQTAHDLLEHLREHAPPESRDTMVERVSLHREIVAAWAEHGG